MSEGFDAVLSYMAPSVAAALNMVSADIRRDVTEIRLRCGAPVSLTVRGKNRLIDRTGRCGTVTGELLSVDSKEMQESYLAVCSHSIHSHTAELSEGFVTLDGGHRVGIAGETVITDSGTVAYRQITSLNYRIAHEVKGCAEPIRDILFRTKGMLICGPPACGKTTVLRDAARLLSGGRRECHRVCLVDTRRELAAIHNGKSGFDLGPCTDVLLGSDPAASIRLAVRVMNPEYIVTDEILSKQETDGLIEGCCCGAVLIASVHAGTPDEVLSKPTVRRLIDAGAVYDLAFLAAVGAMPQYVSVKDRRAPAC